MKPRSPIHAAALALLATLLAVGCASGRTDQPPVHPRDAGLDAPARVCEPACSEGFACVDGACVADIDADDDGIPRSRDCDDFDATVGPTKERPCTSGCGGGVERCTDGVWAACDAPTSCDCEPGTPARTASCGRCGRMQQTCEGGRWVDGACTSEGACMAGAVETGGSCTNCGTQRRTCQEDCSWGAWTCASMGECARGATSPESEPCGSCGGTRTRTRTCGDDCRWDDPAWSACSASGECTAGATESRTVACGNCGLGTKTQTRSCGASCSWGAWTDAGSCSGGGACAPGETRGCPNGDSCGVVRCGASCTWGACEPTVAGGCLRIGRSGLDGSNFRCCTPGGGGSGWQFCLASCQWSTACEAHACP